jgi:iron complex outermembrane receptor protein
MRSTTSRLSLVIATLFPFALAAGAQETPAEPAPSSEPIEQIVITAERRESTVQGTPVSISAFDADAMKRQGISGTADLHLHVPGFFYTEGGGNSPITQIAIRGVGNENVTTGGDPGVAYHFDGVYLSRPTAAAAQLFDAERIEVLRGPQGTLYGRNATGGSGIEQVASPHRPLRRGVTAGRRAHALRVGLQGLQERGHPGREPLV